VRYPGSAAGIRFWQWAIDRQVRRQLPKADKRDVIPAAGIIAAQRQSERENSSHLVDPQESSS